MKERKIRCFFGNVDGKREGMVFTDTITHALKIVDTTYYDFKNYWGEMDKEIGGLKPHVLYTRPNNIHGAPWVAGMCELPVFKTWKR